MVGSLNILKSGFFGFFKLQKCSFLNLGTFKKNQSSLEPSSEELWAVKVGNGGSNPYTKQPKRDPSRKTVKVQS